MKNARGVAGWVCVILVVIAAPYAAVAAESGSIVGWGDQVVGVDLSAGFVAVSAGYGHSLGLKLDGSVVAWGNNENGQCEVPAPNTGFVGVAAGGYHSLGLKADGSVVAWGYNEEGECDVPEPNTGFVAVAAGEDHSLGLEADGSVVAWGANWCGQRNVPEPNTGFVAVAAGENHSLGLKADGSVVAWGYNGYGQCNVPGPNTGFVAVAAGWSHSLGLKGDFRRPIPIAVGERVAGTARPYRFTDYRLDLEAGQAPHLLVRVYPSGAEGSWYVWGSYGSLPMSFRSDWSGEVSSDPGVIEMLIPSPAAGEYFFSVYPYFDVGGAPAPFEIEVLAVERHVSRITPAQGGNTGTTTVRVRGLGFEAGMRVELRDGAGHVLRTANLIQWDGTALMVTLDLTALNAQTADIVVVWPGGEEEVLAAAFEVVPGIGPRLEARLIVPEQVRPGRTYTLWLEYANTGDADMLPPIFQVTNSLGIPLELGTFGRKSTNGLTLLGVSDGEPRGILAPVSGNRIPITFVAPSNSSIEFSLSVFEPDDTPVDWTSLEAELRPDYVENAEWQEFCATARADMGFTWREVAEKLSELATNLAGDLTDTLHAADFIEMLQLGLSVTGSLFVPADCNRETDVTIVPVQYSPANARTLVISHGWRSGSSDLDSLAKKIKAHCPDSNILLVNWRNCADSGRLNPWGAAQNIREAAQVAHAKLVQQYLPVGYDWNSVTYIGHSFGNGLNQEIARLEGRMGNAVILDPNNPAGGNLSSFEGFYTGGSVAVSTASWGDAGPCWPIPRRVADHHLFLPSLSHSGAVNCFTNQIPLPSESDDCDNPWLNGQVGVEPQGAGWYDGLMGCDGVATPTPIFLCRDPLIPLPFTALMDALTRIVRPCEPNEKVGPIGSGDPGTERFIQPGDELQYLVYFENASTATAPAQEVFVTDYLDPDLDWTTFRITEISWGPDHVVTIPPNTAAFYSRETVPDHRPGVDKIWWVDVYVDVNYATGCVQWSFHTLDPDTGELPEDALAGFLPPNTPGLPPEVVGPGEGHVGFTVKAKSDLPPGTLITNSASNVFDVEEPVVTNEVFNTIASETVAVPNVVGMTQAAAETAITAAGLAVGAVTEEYSNTVPTGNVINQNPHAGANVNPGTPVSLMLSRGAEEPPAGCSGGTLNRSTGGRSMPGAPTDTIALGAIMAALVLGGKMKKPAISGKLAEN